MKRAHGAVCLVISLLFLAALTGMAGPSSAALQKPSYQSGDHWVYELSGSLSALPGFNASESGSFHFDLVGRVDVDVI